MDRLSPNARRILDHLYEEKYPRDRTADVIGEALGLSEDEWESALAELFQRGLISTQGKRSYRLTSDGIEVVTHTRHAPKTNIVIEGDVGPGAVVGSGQVSAEAIAGRDIEEGAGAETTPVDPVPSTEGDGPDAGRSLEQHADSRQMRGAQSMNADMNFMTRAILTLDIVDFSLMESPMQMEVIRTLIKMLNEAIPENQNDPSARIWSPAGDGGAITFWNSIHAALDTAIALSKILKAHNKQPNSRTFQLRIGLHMGPVTKEIDFDGRENIWGQGMNISARVTSLAKPGQILVSEEFYRQAQLDVPKPGLQVTTTGKWWVKHNMPIVAYNVFTDDGAGIPPSEVEEWYGPFHYPLAQAIQMYEAMVEEQTKTGPAFRAAVLAKRLLDLAPGHERAQTVIESISKQRFPRATSAPPPLYDIFFSELSPSALLHFFQNAEFMALQSGDTVVEEGEPADSLMMIVSGELVPLIRGDRLKERDPDHPDGEREIVFCEGHITGEMGLFNPGGTRTATLKAVRNTITLTLDYQYLETVDGFDTSDSLLLADFHNRLQIQRRIWQYYCERTIENRVYRHSLFQMLSSAERNRLADSATFLPAQQGQPVTLNVDGVWDSWLIVAAGRVMVFTEGGASVDYRPGDCLGPLRVVTEEAPFSTIEVSPDTHLVSFPWRTIRKLINSSADFRNASVVAGAEDKVRLGLI